MKERIGKQDAANAVDLARESLYESDGLRGVADYIEETGYNPEYRETVVQLLTGVANERLGTAFESLDIVTKYLNQQPKKMRKKKLAVVKKAA